MVIALEMLQAKLLLLPDFPEELKTVVEHLIISHHGQYEFGSPKLPMFPEALMLHSLDNLDSKMESLRAHFEREAAQENPWTSYNPSLGRPLFNSAKYLSQAGKRLDRVSAAAAAAGHPPSTPVPEGEPQDPGPGLLTIPSDGSSEHDSPEK